jgi:hypothetical protein
MKRIKAREAAQELVANLDWVAKLVNSYCIIVTSAHNHELLEEVQVFCELLRYPPQV